MNTRSPWRRAAGASALTLALAGSAVFAATRTAPVNPPEAAAPASGATARSFAALIEQVAPAVVSIDIVGRMEDGRVAFHPSQNGPRGGGEGQASPFGFDPREFFGSPRRAPERRPFRASGSGFFISADGYILTNNHVVEHADEITVRLNDDRELKAKLVGRDPATDLAVIKVEGSKFPYVSFEDRAKPRVGDWVVAVGNPFGLGGTATAGIVSALGRRNVSDSSFVDYMQIDAPINRGNSGGPTFDIYGRVVGVNTAIFSPSGGSVGIGFDIPADVAAHISKQLIENGKVVRGFIGATIQDVTKDIAASLGVNGKGALVAEITPGGPAEKAGLKVGDVVQEVNGTAVDSASAMTRQVALASPGETVKLKVRRAGQVQTVSVQAGQRPSEAQLAGNDQGAAPEAPGTGLLGLALAPDASGGLKVEGVKRGSDAQEKGLRAGDVIRRAGGRQVASVSDFGAAVDQAKKAGRGSVLVLVSRDGRQLFVPLKVEKETARG